MCGLCRKDTPLLAITGKETLTARGKALLIKKGILDQIFYIDPLHNSTVKNCPTRVNIAEEIQKQREKLVEQGIETKANRKMIEHLRAYGTPYGQQLPEEITEVYS